MCDDMRSYSCFSHQEEYNLLNNYKKKFFMEKKLT
jgi:hypothetical protein